MVRDRLPGPRDLFFGGRDLAGVEIRYWLALSAVHGALFLLGATWPLASTAYRVLQYLTLPAIGVALYQLASAYPRVAVCVVAFAALYWALVSLPSLLGRGRPAAPAGFGTAIAETTIFLLATAVVHSALAFVFVIFVNALELLIGAIQAYVFALLTSLYIGDAVNLH